LLQLGHDTSMVPRMDGRRPRNGPLARLVRARRNAHHLLAFSGTVFLLPGGSLVSWACAAVAAGSAFIEHAAIVRQLKPASVR